MKTLALQGVFKYSYNDRIIKKKEKYLNLNMSTKVKLPLTIENTSLEVGIQIFL